MRATTIFHFSFFIVHCAAGALSPPQLSTFRFHLSSYIFPLSILTSQNYVNNFVEIVNNS